MNKFQLHSFISFDVKAVGTIVRVVLGDFNVASSLSLVVCSLPPSNESLCIVFLNIKIKKKIMYKMFSHGDQYKQSSIFRKCFGLLIYVESNFFLNAHIFYIFFSALILGAVKVLRNQFWGFFIPLNLIL